MNNVMPMSGIIVDIILFFIIAGNAVFGYRRGLVKVAFSIFSTIIAIVLVFILYKPTINYVINNTSIKPKLENTLEEKISYLFETEYSNNVETTKSDDQTTAILKVFVGNQIGDMVDNTIDTIAKNVSTEVANKIISVIVIFALFAIIRLLLYALRNYMDAVANLPIIRVFNGSGGMIYGILKGFLIIYVIFAIITIAMPIMDGNIIMTAIEKAPIGSKMFNNNIILNWIFKFL